MVLNSGVRFDAFDPNCRMFDFDEGGEIDVPVKYQLSPRIGVTHPVTERDVFFATYGHYFQMPDLNQMFFGTDYNISGIYSIIGNPDLEAERTVAYEAGVRHRLSETASVALSAFYKDVTGLVRTGPHYSEAYNYYYLYENDDSHGSAWGVEIKVLKLPGDWFSGSAGYSFSYAKGRYSSPVEEYQWGSSGHVLGSTQDNYLDWDQRHQANAHLTISADDGEGPVIVGYRLLENTEISIDWSWGSGFPFSPPPVGVEPEINTERYPWTMQTDMGVSRGFLLGPVELRAGITVFNLFNRRNVDKIFDSGHYLSAGEPGGAMANPGAWSPARHFCLRMGLSW